MIAGVLSIHSVVLASLLGTGWFETIFKKGRVLAYVAALVLGFFIGFRDPSVGPDTHAYVENFMDIASGGIGLVQFEYGYSFFERTFAMAGLSYQDFFVFIGVTSMLLLARYAVIWSVMPLISIAYYFSRYLMSRDLNQIRQAVACIILLFAIKYIVQKSLTKFIMTVGIASLFHLGALIMVLAYVLYNYYFSDSQLLVRKTAILMAVATFGNKLFNPIMKWMSDTSDRGGTYVSDTVNLGSSQSITMILSFELVLLILLLIYINKHPDDLKTLQTTIVYITGIFVLIAFREYPTVAARTSSFITTCEIVLFIPAMMGLLSILGIKQTKYVTYLVSVLFVIVVYYLNSLSAISGYLPPEQF